MQESSKDYFLEVFYCLLERLTPNFFYYQTVALIPTFPLTLSVSKKSFDSRSETPENRLNLI